MFDNENKKTIKEKLDVVVMLDGNDDLYKDKEIIKKNIYSDIGISDQGKYKTF